MREIVYLGNKFILLTVIKSIRKKMENLGEKLQSVFGYNIFTRYLKTFFSLVCLYT